MENTSATVAEIREQWRRRQAWHRAEKSLTLQVKALCRRLSGQPDEAGRLYAAALGKGEHELAALALAATFPLLEARACIEAQRKAVEKRLSLLSGELPVAQWASEVRGLGLVSVAAIVGEAGDLSDYSSPSKLWKRMGLAVLPDGRQRKMTGASAIEHGYSPRRRSVVWNIGDALIKANGPYKAIYDSRKAAEAERVESKAHAHNRAKRYMEKRMLRDMWSAWATESPKQHT